MTTRKADSVSIVAWLLKLLNGGDEWTDKRIVCGPLLLEVP